MSLHVLYVCNFGQGTGYARAAEDYCHALLQAGATLEIQPILPFDELELEGAHGEDLLPYVRGSALFLGSKQPTHAILHAQPRWCLEHALELQRMAGDVPRIAYTTWEAWPAPPELSHRLEEAFDLLMVPSRFCADAFTSTGFPIHRVRIIPHCFDPEAWPLWEPPDVELPHPGDTQPPFVFLSVLSWNARKNPAGLLRAYLTEFRSYENVRLRMLVPSYLEADVAALKAGAQLTDYPALEIINRHVEEWEYRELFEDADCYVTASRGEGWDLPAFDAACMGLPVIAPGFGGSGDFLNLYPGYGSVDFRLTPAILPISPDGRGGAKLVGPDFLTGRQKWAEPDLSHLQSLMRLATQRPEGGPCPGRDRFERDYSYETVGKQFVSMLESFTGEKE